jgi:SAM-dependent methyltransferase
VTDAPIEWTEHSDLVEFYSSSRNRLEDLYPSERRFVPWLASSAKSVLDVGCGAGGFADVWRSFNPGLRYEGVDASAGLIDAARRLHPNDNFWVADGAAGLPVGDGHADVVVGLGWLHLDPRYQAGLTELARASAHHVFIDLRLHDEGGEDRRGAQRLALTKEWDGETTIPYIAVEWSRAAAMLAALRPAKILGLGYRGEPADTVTGIDVPLCLATFVLELAPANPPSKPLVCLDMPLRWPESVEADVRPSTELEELAPAGG